ncbi:putative EH domain, EF-hand domain pair protein [Plasmopara halstedii]
MSGFLHAWVPSSPQEKQYYDLLFTHVDNQHRNAISGQQAVAFFARSHLDSSTLREIWSIADAHQRSELSRNEFYVAMRLISMIQRGEQVSVQRFSQFAAMSYPLAMMDGMPPPSSIQQQPIQSQESHPIEPLCGSMQQQPTPTGPYALSADEKSKYDNIFQQYDTDRDGFIMGSEAVTLFQMSGLDRIVLRNIWSMADITQDSKLSAQEFYVAMHLIVCVSKRGLPMPATLPRELSETAFSSGGTFQNMTQYGVPSSQRHNVRIPSQHDAPVQMQQGSLPPPQPEGMSAFDSFSIVEDTPLPGLASFKPQASSLNPVSGNALNNYAGGSGEKSASTPSGGLHNISTPEVPDTISGRTCINPALTVKSTSSFTGVAPLPTHQYANRINSRNFGSNESIKVSHTPAAGFQPSQRMYADFDCEHFGSPSVNSSDKVFLGDEENKRMVGQLNKLNDEVIQVLAGVKRKQKTIEGICEKVRDLDELRHELVTLVMKREDLRVSTAFTSGADEDVEKDKMKHVLIHSLQSLVENQKQVIQQLQVDISSYEGELEEAVLSAKLQQKLSLDSHPSMIVNGALTSDSVGAAGGVVNAYAPAPFALDDSKGLPSPMAAPSAPSISAFSSVVTDGSGFDPLSNIESAPRSATSAIAKSTVENSSRLLLSPTPSPLENTAADDGFHAFSGFDPADATTSLTANVREGPAKLPLTLVSVDANDSSGFDAFGIAPVSAETQVRLSSQGNMSFAPSAEADEFGFSEFDAAPSSFDTGNSENSSIRTMPSSGVATSLKADSCASANIAANSRAFESSPFLTPSAMENMDFDAFAAAPNSTDNVATEVLLLSSAATDRPSSELNTVNDAGAALNEAVATFESSESDENLLFSPTCIPAAASISSAHDAFGDLSASRKSAVPANAPEIMTKSPFSPVASETNDHHEFGEFITVSTSANRSSSSFVSGQFSVDPSFLPVVNNDSSSEFETFGDFGTVPVSTYNTAIPTAAETSDIGSVDFEASADANTASVSTADVPKILPAADPSDSSLHPPTVLDDSKLGDYDDLSSASIKASVTKPANEVLPVNTKEEINFGDFGDFNTASAPMDQNNFEAFEDFTC